MDVQPTTLTSISTASSTQSWTVPAAAAAAMHCTSAQTATGARIARRVATPYHHLTEPLRPSQRLAQLQSPLAFHEALEQQEQQQQYPAPAQVAPAQVAVQMAPVQGARQEARPDAKQDARQGAVQGAGATREPKDQREEGNTDMADMADERKRVAETEAIAERAAAAARAGKWTPECTAVCTATLDTCTEYVDAHNASASRLRFASRALHFAMLFVGALISVFVAVYGSVQLGYGVVDVKDLFAVLIPIPVAVSAIVNELNWNGESVRHLTQEKAWLMIMTSLELTLALNEDARPPAGQFLSTFLRSVADAKIVSNPMFSKAPLSIPLNLNQGSCP